MHIYIEAQIKDSPLTQQILSTFPQAEIITIKHYKNLFDKHIPYKHQKSLILARLTAPALLPVPPSYGYAGTNYFLRTALNCVFDCAYCYLKGAFRNDTPVIFVNYDEIQQQVRDEVAKQRASGNTETIHIYPSNRTDLLGAEHIGHFHQYFLPFFETLDDVQVESRTKSTNISTLLQLQPSKNTEIAYSLNPQEVIHIYERGTPPVIKRLQAAQQLIQAGRRVGLRIMPLIPIDNYQDIYSNFFEFLKKTIDISMCHSIFVGGFLLTKADYKKMKAKDPKNDLWQMLYTPDEKGLMRMHESVRKEMYELCIKYLPDVQISFDEF